MSEEIELSEVIASIGALDVETNLLEAVLLKEALDDFIVELSDENAEAGLIQQIIRFALRELHDLSGIALATGVPKRGLPRAPKLKRALGAAPGLPMQQERANTLAEARRVRDELAKKIEAANAKREDAEDD